MRIASVEDLMVDQFRELYCAEKMIIAEMPAVIHEIASPSLRQALMDHLEEGAGQVARLGQVFEIVRATSLGARSRAMEVLTADAAELIRRGTKGAVLDAGIIAYVQRIAHFQISAYRAAIAFARMLGLGNVADFLEESLHEVENASESLAAIATEEVFELASHAAAPAH